MTPTCLEPFCNPFPCSSLLRENNTKRQSHSVFDEFVFQFPFGSSGHFSSHPPSFLRDLPYILGEPLRSVWPLGQRSKQALDLVVGSFLLRRPNMVFDSESFIGSPVWMEKMCVKKVTYFWMVPMSFSTLCAVVLSELAVIGVLHSLVWPNHVFNLLIQLINCNYFSWHDQWTSDQFHTHFLMSAPSFFFNLTMSTNSAAVESLEIFSASGTDGTTFAMCFFFLQQMYWRIPFIMYHWSQQGSRETLSYIKHLNFH